VTQRPDDAQEAIERLHRTARLAKLEADVAYFQARLELLGEPRSANQLAQRKVFKLLHKNLGESILKAKRRLVDGG
jgi:hypothetical protein